MEKSNRIRSSKSIPARKASHRRSSHSPLLPISLVLATSTALSIAAAPLSRTVDPIILHGRDLPDLVGQPIKNIGCFAQSPQGLLPIPFQIDEWTAKGQPVLAMGPEANPEDSDGVFSPQDELLFMAKDTGVMAESAAFPIGLVTAVEIEISTPNASETSYIYCAAFYSPPPRSPKDYVRYQPEGERVDGTSYDLRFSSTAPIVFDQLILKRSAGGLGSNPVDRLKIRLEAKVWGTIPIVKTEDDYTSRLIGYIDGPVRVLRRTSNRLVLFWKIPSPSAVQDNYFYDTFFEFPIVVTLPFDLDTFLSEAKLRISVDLKDDPQRAFVNSRNRNPAIMDGIPSNAEYQLDRRPFLWSVVYGTRPDDTAGWVNRLVLGSHTRLASHLYYQDDRSAPDAPEGSPGQVGNVGFDIPSLTGLTKGTHYLTSVLYSFPQYVPGLEKQFLAIRDAPLVARSRRIIHP